MNNQKTKNINYLPLNIQSRIELYLTLNGLKPASVITIRDNKEKNLRRVRNFLRGNHLYFSVDKKDSLQYFASLDRLTTKTICSIWNKDSEKSEIKKGNLLGYPTKAVILFVKYSRSVDRPKFLTGIYDKDFPRSTLDYWPYIGYIVRKGYEAEDSVIAKKWSDFIKQNNPVLARWYEKRIKNAIK